MTHRRSAAALLLLAACCAGPAAAQTSVNPGALDELAPPPASSATPTHRVPVRKPTHRTRHATHETTRHAAAPAKTPVEKTPAAKTSPAKGPAPKTPATAAQPVAAGKLVVPPAAPPPPVLPPPLVVPTRPTPPPPPPPVTPGAAGSATRQKDGMRITFDSGQTDINPATDAAVRTLAHGPAAPPAGALTTYTITAYAPGTPDDPSTPRRVSLSRGLAIRSVLLAEGVPSSRIYVRAMGATGVDFAAGPPDRVDVVVGTGPPPSPVSPVAAPAAKASVTTRTTP